MTKLYCCFQPVEASPNCQVIYPEITTLNCRGIATREKRADMFAKLKEEKNDVLLLQDVHWDNELLLKVKEEWGYKMACSTYTTQARGTAILFNNSFEFVIGEIKRDPRGNYTLVESTCPTIFQLS